MSGYDDDLLDFEGDNDSTYGYKSQNEEVSELVKHERKLSRERQRKTQERRTKSGLIQKKLYLSKTDVTRLESLAEMFGYERKVRDSYLSEDLSMIISHCIAKLYKEVNPSKTVHKQADKDAQELYRTKIIIKHLLTVYELHADPFDEVAIFLSRNKIQVPSLPKKITSRNPNYLNGAWSADLVKELSPSKVRVKFET
ncbi:hypothetical protein K1B32_003284 [Vibrio parahaemolyticus]|nr:hypothetical protein [Vibrio parahaemolyticus]EHZ2740733.1 hypothetical protein [Vibrio parahaemolyticus]